LSSPDESATTRPSFETAGKPRASSVHAPADSASVLAWTLGDSGGWLSSLADAGALAGADEPVGAGALTAGAIGTSRVPAREGTGGALLHAISAAAKNGAVRHV
jgi:hypothetical protein